MRNLILQNWSLPIDSNHLMQLFGVKLKWLRTVLRTKSKDVFGFLDANISWASYIMQEIQYEISNNGIADLLNS